MKILLRWFGKLAVWLHYRRYWDLYMLCQIHEPEIWAKSNRKAKIPTSIRWKVWRRDHMRCVYCGVYAESLTLDHLIPEKFGGDSDAENLVTACSSCNQRKGANNYEEFINSKWLKKKKRLTSHL